jgi:hypothetical protein
MEAKHSHLHSRFAWGIRFSYLEQTEILNANDSELKQKLNSVVNLEVFSSVHISAGQF